MYIVSGCVVAFMFILLLVALAICRFHIKRRWSFRYYTNSASTESESSIPSGGRIISSINIRPSRRNQRSRRSRQHSGTFKQIQKLISFFWVKQTIFLLYILLQYLLSIWYQRGITATSANNFTWFRYILFIASERGC